MFVLVTNAGQFQYLHYAIVLFAGHYLGKIDVSTFPTGFQGGVCGIQITSLCWQSSEAWSFQSLFSLNWWKAIDWTSK